MPPKFEIEGIFQITNIGLAIAARLIDKTCNFHLTDHSELGGIPIKNWYDIPRAKDEDGVLRLDLFIFCLKNPADKDKLKENEVVELTQKEEKPSRK